MAPSKELAAALRAYARNSKKEATSPKVQRQLLKELDRARASLAASVLPKARQRHEVQRAARKARSAAKFSRKTPKGGDKLVEIQFKYEWSTDKGVKCDNIGVRTRSISVHTHGEEVTNDWVADQIDEYLLALEQSDEYRGLSAKRLDGSKPTVQVTTFPEKSRSLADAPMKYAVVAHVSGLQLPDKLKDYNDIKDQCTLNWLRAHFKVEAGGKSNGLKKFTQNNAVIAMGCLGLLGTYGNDRIPATKSAIEGLLAKPGVQEQIEQLMQDGVTAKQVRNFCMAAGVSMRALDQTNKVICHYDPPLGSVNSLARCVLYRVQNNHMYPIVDQRIINAIFHATKNSCSVHAKKPKASSVDRNVIMHDGDASHWAVLMESMKAHMVDGKITLPAVIKPTLDGNGLHRFTYVSGDKSKEVHVLETPDDLDAALKLVARRMGLPGRTNVPGLATACMQAFCPALPKSVCNPNMDRVLREDYMKSRALLGKYTDLADETIKQMVQDGRATCRDIVKAFTHCLVNPLDEWQGCTYTDDWCEWTLHDDAPLDLGLYHVAEDSYWPLKGNKVYTRRILEFARSRGIPFTILAWAPCSRQPLPKDFFHALVARVLEACHSLGLRETDYVTPEQLVTVGKGIINCAVGMLATDTKREVSACHLSTDAEEAFEWCKNNAASSHFFRELVDLAGMSPEDGEECIGAKQLYLYGSRSATPLSEHNIPMWLQLTDHANIMLYELAEAMGGEVLYAKTDCVITSGGQEVIPAPCPVKLPLVPAAEKPVRADILVLPACVRDFSIGGRDPRRADRLIRLQLTFTEDVIAEADDRTAALGTSRDEHVPRTMWPVNADGIDPDFNAVPSDWQTFPIADSDNYKDIIAALEGLPGMLIEAGPGRGKSFVAKHLMKAHKCLVVAPTHTAANNIGGGTIQSLLCYNPQTNTVGLKSLKQRLDGIEYIIVDELSMVDRQLIRHLVEVKRAHPELKFVLLGDRRQLQGVGERQHFFEHSSVKFLTGSTRVQLTVPHRNDPKLTAAMEQAWARKFDAATKLGQDPMSCELGIAPDNVCCRWVNLQKMLHHKPRDPVIIPADANVEHAWEVYLFAKLPLVSNRTTRPKEDGPQMYNQEFWTLTMVKRKEGTFFAKCHRTGEKHKFKIAEFHRNFTVGYCVTVHKVQGMTIETPLALWGYDQMKSPEMRWTAMSRVRTLDQLHYGAIPEEVRECSRRRANILKKRAAYICSDTKCERPVCDYMPDDIEALLQQQDDSCYHCGDKMLITGWTAVTRLQQWTLDRLGGVHSGHTKGNCVAACLGCNVKQMNEQKAAALM